MTVALGCRLATRRGVWRRGMIFNLNADSAQCQRQRVERQLHRVG
jgi:hypothetical protein